MSRPHYPRSATGQYTVFFRILLVIFQYTAETAMRIMPDLKEAGGQGSKDTVGTDPGVGTTTEPVITTVTNRDVILYALGGEVPGLKLFCHVIVM